MKRIFSVALMLGISGVAHAQQPPNPQVAIYSQLLTEANSRLAAAGAQEQVLMKQRDDALAEVKRLTDKYEPKKPTEPKP
jgi:hypothetical protein